LVRRDERCLCRATARFGPVRHSEDFATTVVCDAERIPRELANRDKFQHRMHRGRREQTMQH